MLGLQPAGELADLGQRDDREGLAQVRDQMPHEPHVGDVGGHGHGGPVGGWPVADQRLQRQAHNANDWYVLAAARAPVAPLYGVSGWSVALVVAALVLLVFAAVSFFTHHRVLGATSISDALTGIPNRRKLKLDLDERLKEASPARPLLLLLLFDLNGFKANNDTFGHPAGGRPTARAATCCSVPSRSACPSWPNTTPPPPGWPRPSGPGWGCQPRTACSSARRPSCMTLGKLGIPDEILTKPGPLTPPEWVFVRRHPLIGARIIGAAPALAGPEAVAELRRVAGTQFDAAVVDAFSELVVDLLWPTRRDTRLLVGGGPG